MEFNVALEVECDQCSGTGDYHEYGPKGSSRPGRSYEMKGDVVIFTQEDGCPYCNGTGLRLTQFGNEVLDAVRRHLVDNPNVMERS